MVKIGYVAVTNVLILELCSVECEEGEIDAFADFEWQSQELRGGASLDGNGRSSKVRGRTDSKVLG